MMLLVFTALFGLRVAVPILTLTQLAGNGGRAWFNRQDIQWRLIRWHAIGAIPFALAGGLLLAYVPVVPLKRLLGATLIAVVVWRRLRRAPHPPGERTFIAVGAGTGLGSSLLGAAGPIAAPFFLARGLVGGAYIGTEASASLVIHLTKLAAYSAGSLLSLHLVGLGLVLTPVDHCRSLARQENSRAGQRARIRPDRRGRNAGRGGPAAHRCLTQRSFRQVGQ